MPTQANAAAAAQTLTSLLRIQVLVTSLMSLPQPTQAQIDQVIAEAATTGGIIPQVKPTYSKDGISYDWGAYLTIVGNEIDKQLGRVVLLQGPFEIRSRAF